MDLKAAGDPVFFGSCGPNAPHSCHSTLSAKYTVLCIAEGVGFTLGAGGEEQIYDWVWGAFIRKRIIVVLDLKQPAILGQEHFVSLFEAFLVVFFFRAEVKEGNSLSPECGQRNRDNACKM